MSPLSQSLASLAQQHKLAGTLASVVRAEMPAIEAARLAGLSFAQICQGLEALGISASARTLRHTVYRIQAEQRRKAPAEGRAPEGPDKSARMPARAAPSVSTAPAKGDESKPKVAPMVQAEVQATDQRTCRKPNRPDPRLCAQHHQHARRHGRARPAVPQHRYPARRSKLGPGPARKSRFTRHAASLA